MSEVTSTRKVLRRAIARAARLEFFRRYSANEVALTGTPTTTTLPSTSLTQVDDFWNGGWAYIVDGTQAGEERKITDFAAASDTLSLEYALAGAPAAGAKIEIYSVWSAADIHEAINRAIREWGRMFFDTVVDKSVVLCEDKMEYDISALTKKIWSLRQIRVERSGNNYTGQVDSASVVSTHVQLVDAERFKTNDQYNGYKVSIYDGTGKGQVGDVVDTVASGTYITITTAQFATTPDSTSKYRLWDATEQLADSLPLVNWRTDAHEFPDVLYLNKLETEHYGMRLFLIYTHVPTELSADTDTTIVPKEFIISQALAYLHESLMGDNRSDANRHANIAALYRQQAAEYMARFTPRQPGATLTIDQNTGFVSDIEDPLGWRS